MRLAWSWWHFRGQPRRVKQASLRWHKSRTLFVRQSLIVHQKDFLSMLRLHLPPTLHMWVQWLTACSSPWHRDLGNWPRITAIAKKGYVISHRYWVVCIKAGASCWGAVEVIIALIRNVSSEPALNRDWQIRGVCRWNVHEKGAEWLCDILQHYGPSAIKINDAISSLAWDLSRVDC